MDKRPRGRPPHPDILTPREWEVLELLRHSLSNEEIADRLDISVPGVKYHVSQILSKLHVSSREEAAAWQLEEHRRTAWPALPLAAKAAGLTVIVAAIAAVAVLAYGVSQTEGGDPQPSVVAFDLEDLQPGKDPARDLVLLDSGLSGDIARVEIRPASGGEIASEFDFIPGTPLDNVSGWRLTITTWSETFPGFLSGPVGRPDPPPGCYQATIWTNANEPAADNVPGSFNSTGLVDDSECDVESITRDTAIVIAGREGHRSRNSETSAPLVASTTLGAATQALAEAGFSADYAHHSSEKTVWLVIYEGPFVDTSLPPTQVPKTARPTPIPICSRVATIVDATNGDVLLSEAIPLGPC